MRQSEAGGGCFERRAPRVLDSDVGGVHVTDTITIARRISPARRVWGCVWRSALIRARVRVVVMDARGMGDAGATRGEVRTAPSAAELEARGHVVVKYCVCTTTFSGVS